MERRTHRQVVQPVWPHTGWRDVRLAGRVKHGV